jgi:hypothetical protein
LPILEINLMSWHRYSSWLIAENSLLSEVYFLKAIQAPATAEQTPKLQGQGKSQF